MFDESSYGGELNRRDFGKLVVGTGLAGSLVTTDAFAQGKHTLIVHHRLTGSGKIVSEYKADRDIVKNFLVGKGVGIKQIVQTQGGATDYVYILTFASKNVYKSIKKKPKKDHGASEAVVDANKRLHGGTYSAKYNVAGKKRKKARSLSAKAYYGKLTTTWFDAGPHVR